VKNTSKDGKASLKVITLFNSMLQGRLVKARNIENIFATTQKRG
jgi:hypothetical protein